MNRFLKSFCRCLAIITIFISHAFAAEVAIDIEVAMMPGVSITAPQEWAERLGKIGLDRVQIRSMRGNEQPLTELNDTQTRLKVLALLSPNDELILPTRKFGIAHLSQLRAYFEGLPAQVIEEGIVRGPMGLTEEEFQTALVDMAKPLGTSTVGKTSRDVLAQCEARFRLPIRRDASSAALLQAAKPLDADLEKFAAGTALAIALRRDQLMLRPAHIGSGLELVVTPYIRGEEAWPLGWKAKETPRQLVPKLYESLTIEIDGFTLATALTALAPRLALPVVMDERVLEGQGIDPAKIPVKLPAKKTFLKSAVDRLLAQARLAGEVRIDDAGMAFLWVTQFGPDSRPAK
jgi:hypothetical protein